MQESGFTRQSVFIMQKPKQLIFDFDLDQKAGLNHFYFQSERLASLFDLESFFQFPNELLLMGLPGTGKSYLTQALLNDATSKTIKASYLPLQAITKTAVTSLEGYEQFELVIIDGLEHLSSTKDWQTIVFNFLNLAYESNCKVILTAAANIPELNFFPDLHSRLMRMEMESLSPLQNDTLRQAIAYVCDSYNITISSKEVEYLLKRYQRDIGSIMQAIHSLDALSASQKRRITVPLIKEFLDSK